MNAQKPIPLAGTSTPLGVPASPIGAARDGSRNPLLRDVHGEGLSPTGEAGAPNLSNPYTYEHVDLDDNSWIADEDFVSDWGPYGLRETDQGLRATTLPRLGATTSRSLVLNVPLCAGCNEPITGGAKDGDGGVCHDCEVVFHRAEPDEALVYVERIAPGRIAL